MYTSSYKDRTDDSQTKQTNLYSVESSSSSSNFDKYNSRNTSKLNQPAARNGNTRTNLLQKQNFFDQDGLSKDDSSRFTSTQKWSTQSKASMNRSKSVEPSSRLVEPITRKYSEGSSYNQNRTGYASYYPEKRSNSTQYSGTENKDYSSRSFSPSTSASPSYDSTSTYGRDYRAKEEPKLEYVSQQEFFQRLSRAHSIVDELLKSRGLKFEEDPVIARRWEPIEIIQEETVPSPVRSLSSVSDSGLSLDNESDDSSSTELKMPSFEEAEQCERSLSKSPQNEYVLMVRLWTIHILVAFTATLPARKPLPETLTLVNKPTVTPMPEKVALNQEKEEKKLVKSKNAPKKVNVKKKPATPKHQLQVDDSREPEPATSKKTAQKTEEKKMNQRLTLARYFRKKNLYGRSSAEISIQHVSFYQVAQSLIERQKAVEKSVRIHLRLTERAPTFSQTTTVLYTKKRVAHVVSDIIFAMGRKAPSENQKPPKLRRIVPAHVKRQEVINPIQIPENFMKMLNPVIRKAKEKEPAMDNEIQTARGNLKRVPFNRTILASSLAVYMIRDQRYSSPVRDYQIRVLNTNVSRNKAPKTKDQKLDHSIQSVTKTNTNTKKLENKNESRKKNEINHGPAANKPKNSYRSRRRVVTPTGEASAVQANQKFDITTKVEATSNRYTTNEETKKYPVGVKNRKSSSLTTERGIPSSETQTKTHSNATETASSHSTVITRTALRKKVAVDLKKSVKEYRNNEKDKDKKSTLKKTIFPKPTAVKKTVATTTPSSSALTIQNSPHQNKIKENSSNSRTPIVHEILSINLCKTAKKKIQKNSTVKTVSMFPSKTDDLKRYSFIDVYKKKYIIR